MIQKRTKVVAMTRNVQNNHGETTRIPGQCQVNIDPEHPVTFAVKK
jgi:hypothetical protein